MPLVRNSASNRSRPPTRVRCRRNQRHHQLGGSFSRAIACANAPLRGLLSGLLSSLVHYVPPHFQQVAVAAGMFHSQGRTPYAFVTFGRCTPVHRHGALPTFPCVHQHSANPYVAMSVIQLCRHGYSSGCVASSSRIASACMSASWLNNARSSWRSASVSLLMRRIPRL